VTNWPSYETGLRARGSLTVWFTAEAIAAWRAEPRTTRSGQARYSSLALVPGQQLGRLRRRQPQGRADRGRVGDPDSV
jgi:hypothetical protein